MKPPHQDSPGLERLWRRARTVMSSSAQKSLMAHENKVWKMQPGLRLDPSVQVYSPCLPVNPGCDIGLGITYSRPLSTFFSWWSQLSFAASPALSSSRPHPEGDESQSIVLSVDDFLYGDLHAIVDYLLFWPVFRALLQGPRRSGCVTLLFSSHIPSCSAGANRRAHKDNRLCY